MPDAVVRLEVLGGFRLLADGASIPVSTRAQSLIAWLALRSGEFVPRQRVAFLFWPDSPEAQARTNLRQLLHHLRTAWPESEAWIESAGPNLRWRPDPSFQLDAAELEAAVAEGSGALARGDATAGVRAYERAVSLYQGELLAGLYDEWIDAERPRYVRAYLRAAGALIELYERSGDYPAGIRHAEALATLDPLSESAWQHLIRLHAAAGDRAAALRAYDQCAAALRRELSTEPGPATRRERAEALGASPAAPVPAPASTLVGRAAEWSTLSDAWRRAAAGRASFALITGDAGIGKTTLVRELARAAAFQGVAAEAACYAFEFPIAYAPIAGWLRSTALRGSVAALPETQRAQLARVIPELFGDASPIGMAQPFTDSWQRRHFYDAVARAVWSVSQPLLLFLDDLQWCDPESLDWLIYLLRARPAARLLVAATARFDEVGREGPTARAVARLLETPGALEIALAPLNADETAELAGRLSPSAVDAATLYGQTGGNPLFIVETVRAGMAASPKVQSVITMRLGQLAPSTRELALDAAAVGRPFTLELLHAAEFGDEPSIAAAVDELFARGILHSRDGLLYDFSHGQLRDVTYGQLGPARRRLAHRRLAQALEQIGEPAAEAAEIAAHYERAGDASQAVAFWERAAAVARVRYAEEDSIAYLNRALRLLEALPPGRERDRLEVRLLVALGPPLMATQGYASAEAGRVNARARMLCELTGDSHAALPVFCGSWAFHVVKGELAASHEIASRFLRVAGEPGVEPSYLAAAHFTVGSSLLYMGRVREALARWEGAQEIFRSRPEGDRFYQLGPELDVFHRAHRAHALWFMGRSEDALVEMEGTIAHARDIAHPFSLALALAYEAMLRQFRDEPDGAEARAAEVAELCEKHDFRYYLAWTPILAGWAHSRRGDPAGLDQMREGIAALEATGARLRLPYYLTILADALRRSGRAAEGFRQITRAAEVCRSGGELWVKSELDRVKGDLLIELGRADEAADSYRSALRSAVQQSAAVFESRAKAALERVAPPRSARAPGGPA
jgi:DNA-binding SARP family transcriptional activator/predicted ATPase